MDADAWADIKARFDAIGEKSRRDLEIFDKTPLVKEEDKSFMRRRILSWFFKSRK